LTELTRRLLAGSRGSQKEPTRSEIPLKEPSTVYLKKAYDDPAASTGNKIIIPQSFCRSHIFFARSDAVTTQSKKNKDARKLPAGRNRWPTLAAINVTIKHLEKKKHKNA